MSSWYTMPTTCWLGLRAFKTFSPTACSVTCDMKSRTTGKLTSASSSDFSTSLSPSRMFDSESFPCPRSVLSAEFKPSCRASNISWQGTEVGGQGAEIVGELRLAGITQAQITDRYQLVTNQ